MKLQYIRVRNFRNHTETTLDCSDPKGDSYRCNFLLGDNGQGKTNLLEAIAYLSLTKSVFGSSDATVLAIGKDSFEIEGRFRSDYGLDSEVRIAYSVSTGEKSVTINQERVTRFSDVVGLFPIVVLAPEHHAITLGAPADRRKFLDFVLSQASKSYLLDLLEYRRVLKHRNRLLQEWRGGREGSAANLEVWDDQLIRYGSRLVSARITFLETFRMNVLQAYKELIEGMEEPGVHYISTISENQGPLTHAEKEAVEKLFLDAVRKSRESETRSGMTLVGPHRDDLVFTINGLDARMYASQGQHKTLLIALKAAEFAYLREKRRETPIMLLDDVFGELDETRAKLLLRFLESVGQTFITAARDVVLGSIPEEHCRRFYIAQGALFDFKWS